MPGYRFAEDFINPNSDAFRSQFPTLHCNLMVAGHFESSYTQTVGKKFIKQALPLDLDYSNASRIRYPQEGHIMAKEI